jgi:hypothetical protein
MHTSAAEHLAPTFHRRFEEHGMGNTNLPQFGAADADNSRDTLSDDQQLTEEQKKQRAKAAQQSPGGQGSAAGEESAEPSHEALGGHADTGHSPSDAT